MNIALRLQQLFCLVLGVILLTGCGYHLRRPIKLAPDIQNLYVQSNNPNDSFMLNLKNLLKANHVHLTSQPVKDGAILNIENIAQYHQLTSLSGSAEAGQYELFAEVRFKLTDDQGRTILPSRIVRTTRSYNTNVTQILSSSSTANQFWKNMQIELANEILSQLARVSPSSSS